MRRRDTLKSRLLRPLIPERIPWFAARLYDQIASTAVDTYYAEVAEDVVANMSEGLVLDIGTGPGYLPIEIARRGPRITVVGIDSSEALVRIARKNVERAGVEDRVRFLRRDANRLDFEANSYDFVISTGSLHAWKNPVVVINKCFRVLKPGHEAWILDPAHVITPEALHLMEELKGIDRLAHWWGSFTSKLTPPYSAEDIEEIIRFTKFGNGRITEGKWLAVMLRKHIGPATEGAWSSRSEFLSSPGM